MDNWEQLNQYDHSFESDYFETAVTKYSSHVGEFLMRFSLLEHQLNVKIANIIHDHTHEIGYQIMENMNMRSKIDLFIRLCNRMEDACDNKEKNKLLEIKKMLNDINTFRNSIAHAYWHSIEKNWKVRTKFSTDQEWGGVIFKNKIISPKDVKAKIKEITKLISKFEKYREDFQ